MAPPPNSIFILCNQAEFPSEYATDGVHKELRLEYEDTLHGFRPNVKVQLQRFIRDLNHLPDRIRDLLEIAAYVYCADRLISRGQKDTVEFQSWSRHLHFVIKVRDHDFWNTRKVRDVLSDTLIYMSGDAEYGFTFQPGRTTVPVSLFDKEVFLTQPEHPSSVVLFSGGLDSLAGTVQELTSSQVHLYLISHRSNQPSTTRTQDSLVRALRKDFKDRVKHYRFYCHLRGTRAQDENQRTRAFLYTSIAFALSKALRQDAIKIYENGVTALNFPKRADMGNARASRTAHPKTVTLLQEFFSLVNEGTFQLLTPFVWKTKADVFRILNQWKAAPLISSSVSCGKTFKTRGTKTHCGECSQCIDRRISAFASGLDEFDHSGLYALDFLRHELEGEAKTLYLDYVRWSRYFSEWSLDAFYHRMINELVDACDGMDLPEDEAVNRLFDLHHRHGLDVIQALKRIMDLHYDPFTPHSPNQFLRLIFNEEHLKDPVDRLARDICSKMKETIPIAYRRGKPANENDFNDKVEALLKAFDDDFAREYPTIPFAMARAIPDHSWKAKDLLIESKYLRGTTTPSKATEAIAADLTKYPSESYLLFIIYDPERSISDDSVFIRDIEGKRPGRCRVCIVR